MPVDFDDDYVITPKSQDVTIEWGQPGVGVTDALDRVVPEPEKAKRIAFVEGQKLTRVRMHWTTKCDKKFSFHCHTTFGPDGKPTKKAPCCILFNGSNDTKMTEYVIAPVIQYTNTEPDGKYPNGYDGTILFELATVRMSASQYRQVVIRTLEDDKPWDCDWIVSLAGKKHEYHPTSKNKIVRYRQNPDLFARISADLVNYKDGTRLYKMAANVITEAELLHLCKLNAANGEVSNG
jgi:hypothetical protein